jgi:hypothetical protein
MGSDGFMCHGYMSVMYECVDGMRTYGSGGDLHILLQAA